MTADPARPGHYIRTPIPGNIIPQNRISDPTVFNWYTSRLPAPNNNPSNPLTEPFNNFLALGQADNVNYTGLASREDWAPNLKNRFSFSWNWSHFIENAQDWTYASSPGLQDWDNIRTARGGIVNWTYSQSSATVITASVSANQWLNVQETTGARQYKPSDIGFPTYMDARCQALGGCAVPLVTWNGYTSAYDGNSLVMGRTLSPDVRQRSLGLKSSVSHVRGAHSLQGGIDFRQAYATSTGGAGNSMGSFTFNSQYVQKNDDSFTPAGSLGLSYASFMLGIPSSMSSDNNASYALMNPYYGWYGQDTWRVTKNLTVTLGLRIEYEQAPTERYNRALTYFDPNAQLPIAAAAQAAYAANPVPELAAGSFTVQGGSVYAGVNGAPRQPWQNQLMWLPRLSAAWQFSPKMILRGGYGVYYDSINVQNVTLAQSGFSRTTSTNLTNNYGVNWLAGNPGAGVSPMADPFPVRSDGTRFDSPLGSSLGAMYVDGQSFSYSPFDRKHPREQQWRVGVERQISPNMSVQVYYWGMWGSDLAVSQNQSALPAQYWNTTEVRNNTLASNMSQNVSNPFYIGNFASLQTSNPALYQQMSTLGFFTSTDHSEESAPAPLSEYQRAFHQSVLRQGQKQFPAGHFPAETLQGLELQRQLHLLRRKCLEPDCQPIRHRPASLDTDQYPAAEPRQRHRPLRTPLRKGPGAPDDRNSQPRYRQLAGGFDLRLPTRSVSYLGQQLLLRRLEQGLPSVDSRHEDPESMVQHQRAVREEFGQRTCVIPGAHLSGKRHFRAGRRPEPVECQPAARLPIAGGNDLRGSHGRAQSLQPLAVQPRPTTTRLTRRLAWSAARPRL